MSDLKPYKHFKNNNCQNFSDSFQNGSSKNGAIKNGGNDVTLSKGNGNAKDPEKGDTCSTTCVDTEMVMPVFQDVEYPMNDDAFESNLPKPPDGGWGWWVVFASFMIHVIGKTTNFAI